MKAWAQPAQWWTQEGCSWVPWSVKLLWLEFCKAHSHVCYSHTEWLKKKKKKSMPLRTRGKKADLGYRRASLAAQLVKNLCALQETPVQLLGQEDPLEKGLGYPLQYSWASLVAQMVKDPPAMGETWV